MSNKKFLLYFVLLLMFIFDIKISSSLVVEGSMISDVELAEFIVTVKIDDIEVRKEDHIYTYISFTPLEFLKGEPNELPRTLRLRGGKIEGRGEIFTDIPQFEIDHKYLLFLRFDNPYCPILGLYLRTFKIKYDSNLRTEVVLSYHNENIYGFKENGLLKKRKLSEQENPLTFEVFGKNIREIQATKNYRDRSRER